MEPKSANRCSDPRNDGFGRVAFAIVGNKASRGWPLASHSRTALKYVFPWTLNGDPVVSMAIQTKLSSDARRPIFGPSQTSAPPPGFTRKLILRLMWRANPSRICGSMVLGRFGLFIEGFRHQLAVIEAAQSYCAANRRECPPPDRGRAGGRGLNESPRGLLKRHGRLDQFEIDDPTTVFGAPDDPGQTIPTDNLDHFGHLSLGPTEVRRLHFEV